ncbi:MAG: hypothetical protein WCH11_02560, partial [Bdellovibrio sp.]
MLLDLRPHGQWEQVNVEVARFLSLPEGEIARAGVNIGALAMETALGFFHQYSHRPQVALIKGNSPVLDPIHAYLLKEAVAVQVFQAADVEDISQIIPQLKADLCFFAYVEDHPVTGELLPKVDRWPQALHSARIPFLRLSHHAHRLRKWSQEPCLGFEFQIGSWGARGAVARHGSRWKSVPAVFHPWLLW